MKCNHCSILVMDGLLQCPFCGQPLLNKSELKRPLLVKEALNYYSQNKFERAESLLLELIIRKPDEVFCQNLLGSIYLKQQKLNLALLHFQRALELEAASWEIYYNLGITYALQERHAEAKKFFRRVSKLNSNHYLSLYNLGTILLKEGLYTEALQAFLQVREIAPNYTKNQINLTLVYNKIRKLSGENIDDQASSGKNRGIHSS